MTWFSGLFLCAAVVALATGKAYFRGVVDRDDSPARYWSVVAGVR